MATKKSTNKKQQNKFMKLISKLTATRRATFATGLVGILIFSSVGYYVISSSSASSATSICGTGFVIVSQKNTANSSTVYLMNNRTTKTLCALNLSTGTKYGYQRTMEVDLRIVGKDDSRPPNSEKSDGPAPYYKYAGPVKIGYKYAAWATPSRIGYYDVVVEGKSANKNYGSPGIVDYWPASDVQISVPAQKAASF